MPDKDEFDVLLDSALATYADRGTDGGLERRVLAAVAAEHALGQERRAAGWWGRRLAWAIAVPVAASLLVWMSVGRIRQHAPAQREQAHRQDSVVRHETMAQKNGPPAAAERATHSRRTEGGGRLVEPSGTAETGPFQNGGPAGLKHAARPCPAAELDSLATIGVTSTSCPAAHAGTQRAAALPLPKLDVFPAPQPLTAQERALVSVTREAPVPVRKALADVQDQDSVPIHIAAIHIPPVEPLIDTQR